MKSGKALQKVAIKRAEKLPGVQVGHPFGPDYEAYEVAGKIFLLVTRIPRESTAQGLSAQFRGKRVVIVKTDPADAKALREEYPEIAPGYHMNKDHWITIANGELIKKKLLKELVSESYRLVVETLPKGDPQRKQLDLPTD